MEEQKEIAKPEASSLDQTPDKSGASGPVYQPIEDWVTRPDYPEGLLGHTVAIGGYAGEVVAVVKNSIKVRAPEGVTRSFNCFGLRRIYGPPPPEPEPKPAATAETATVSLSSSSRPNAPEPKPKREVILEPDFSLPCKPLAELIAHPDFPKSAFGQHVEIGGYTGVVVEIVNQSLKIRSRQGTSRSYNAEGLRKIYGPAASS